MAGDALDLDFAIQGIQIGAHHVETDAAAGQFGLDGRGRESRMEEHFAHVAFGEAIGGFHRNQAALDGALLHAPVVDPAAVVLDFNVDVVAAVIRAQHDFSRGRLSRGGTIVAVLDSVRDGVTDEMSERIRNLLNDVVVEFGFASREFEFDFLVGRFGSVPHGARQARIQRPDGHHARGGDLILQVMRKFAELVNVTLDAPDESPELREHFVHVR